MESITFTRDFPKINIQIYAAEFVFEIDGKSFQIV